MTYELPFSKVINFNYYFKAGTCELFRLMLIYQKYDFGYGTFKLLFDNLSTI